MTISRRRHHLFEINDGARLPCGNAAGVGVAMSSAALPDNVKAAAAVVDAWVREQETRRLTPDELAKLTPAQKLDYCRRFDQSKMSWKDPRG